MSPNIVAVWLLQPDPEGIDRHTALHRFKDLLSEKEIDQALACPDEEANVLYVCGRALLQPMLRHYLPPLPKFTVPRCTLRIPAGGKPVLGNTFADSGLDFSLSHSGRYVACALAWRREIRPPVVPGSLGPG